MDEQGVRKELERLQVPAGLIGGINVKGDVATVVLEAEAAQLQAMEPVRQQVEDGLKSLPGISRVQVVVTAAKPAPQAKPQQRPVAPGVKAIIAVASGKGGVGKSTVATNLAAAALANGLTVGLLDADIYGPSQPTLLGIDSGVPPLDEQRLMIPPVAHGIKVMSMGFMVDPSRALVWRGPMVHSAINQMLRDVAWGELDLLIVDMPPGTGDAQLSLAQNARLSGAVIVSTPQDLALADARRAVAMFRQVNVPVLGLIENMSLYHCPNCGHEAHIFGHGGAKAEAEKLGIPFLGELALDRAVRVASDEGMPLVLSAPEGTHARHFRDMADQLGREIHTQVRSSERGGRL